MKRNPPLFKSTLYGALFGMVLVILFFISRTAVHSSILGSIYWLVALLAMFYSTALLTITGLGFLVKYLLFSDVVFVISTILTWSLLFSLAFYAGSKSKRWMFVYYLIPIVIPLILASIFLHQIISAT